MARTTKATKTDKIELYTLDQFFLTIRDMPKYKHVSKVTLEGFRRLMEQQDKAYSFDGGRDYLEALDSYIAK